MAAIHIDRALSVYLCHPLARRLRRRPQPRIPILMYHSIGEGGGRRPYYETNTSSEVFARQMKFLRENRYKALNLDEAVSALAGQGSSEKAVVISFDDGYRDFYSHAYPILAECGFTATVFVVTQLLKSPRKGFKGKECLTPADIRELHAQGVRFGSHTATHPELKALSHAEVECELKGSKQDLEDTLGAPIQSFSFPFAFPETDREFVGSLAKLLGACGYANGVTTILGTARPTSHRFFLPRLPISSFDDLRFFRAKLEGAYDWLHAPQYLVKAVQGFLS